MTNDSKEAKITETIIQVIKERNSQTVEQLTTLVKERIKIPEKEILNHIIKLQNTGKIWLRKQVPPIPMKLAAYLKTEHAIWYWATITTAIATAAVVFTVPEDAYPIVYLRYILGSIFILWLPGYTFKKALYPEKELDNIERIALSIGMSIALVPIIGLLLNYTPFWIRLTPITLSLLALTIIFATAAIVREHQIGIKQTLTWLNSGQTVVSNPTGIARMLVPKLVCEVPYASGFTWFVCVDCGLSCE